MGQRHQIYIVLPYEFQQRYEYYEGDNIQSTVEYKRSNIIALYHHWLYGVSAGRQLFQFLNFYKKGMKDKDFIFGKTGIDSANAEYAASAIYSLDFKNARYAPISIEGYEVSCNPLLADNDDGITIIDIRGNKPKYCFMCIGRGGKYVEHFTPLKAIDYMENYYGEQVLAENSYWQQHTDTFRNMQKQMMKVSKDLEKYEVLSEKEVEAIFPQIFQRNVELNEEMKI